MRTITSMEIDVEKWSVPNQSLRLPTYISIVAARTNAKTDSSIARRVTSYSPPMWDRSIPRIIRNDADTIPSAIPIMIARCPAELGKFMIHAATCDN